MKLKIAALALAILACVGCANTRRAEVEVITVEQQALDEIRRTPTSFTVPAENDRQAWQRAKSFFDLYLPGRSGAPKNYSVMEDSRVTNAGYPGAKYVFDVQRRLDRQGIHYTVQCRPAGPGAQAAMADRNARNVARFIKDGTLERSLLDV